MSSSYHLFSCVLSWSSNPLLAYSSSCQDQNTLSQTSTLRSPNNSRVMRPLFTGCFPFLIIVSFLFFLDFSSNFSCFLSQFLLSSLFLNYASFSIVWPCFRSSLPRTSVSSLRIVVCFATSVASAHVFFTNLFRNLLASAFSYSDLFDDLFRLCFHLFPFVIILFFLFVMRQWILIFVGLSSMPRAKSDFLYIVVRCSCLSDTL